MEPILHSVAGNQENHDRGLIMKNGSKVLLCIADCAGLEGDRCFGGEVNGVGDRHGKPVVLTIRAGEMDGAGIIFCCSANGVWLVNHVPPQYINFPH
jgi:hypothetical protein